MQTREWHSPIIAKDKPRWGDGPWQSEPDKKQWQDPATGLPCLIVRNPSGAWCGYVGVRPDHPLHGADWGDIDEQVRMHGGVTFTEHCVTGHPEEVGVCHVPDPGEPDDVLWIGFDCSHGGDLSPSIAATLRECRKKEGRPTDLPGDMPWLPENPESRRIAELVFREVYRDQAYVEAEVTYLAAQLEAVRCGEDAAAIPEPGQPA